MSLVFYSALVLSLGSYYCYTIEYVELKRCDPNQNYTINVNITNYTHRDKIVIVSGNAEIPMEISDPFEVVYIFECINFI